MTVRLKNNYGIVKETKTGFSWTVLFFGFFVPFIRGDIQMGVIMLVVNFIVGFITGPGVILAWIVWAALYNKLFLKGLMEKGFAGLTVEDDSIIRSYIA